MNFLTASVEGNRANLGGATVDLGSDYGAPKGELKLGIRPEFVTLTSGEGLPVTINRVQDAGRQKFVSASLFGAEINLIVDGGTAIEADMNRVAFDPDRISVFCDDWRIEPNGASSTGKAGA